MAALLLAALAWLLFAYLLLLLAAMLVVTDRRGWWGLATGSMAAGLLWVLLLLALALACCSIGVMIIRCVWSIRSLVSKAMEAGGPSVTARIALRDRSGGRVRPRPARLPCRTPGSSLRE